MDASSETSPAQDKKPLRPCPKCPHRLSDLWTHENPAEATRSSEVSKEEISANDNNSEGGSSSTAVEDYVHDEDTSRFPPDYLDTSSERSNPPEYTSNKNDSEEEYHELQSDDEPESNDEHETDEHYKSAKEDQSDEEHLLDEHLAEAGFEGAQVKKCEFCEMLPTSAKCPICAPWLPPKPDSDSRNKEKLLPEWYTCRCGEIHGIPSDREKTKATFASEDYGQSDESYKRNKQYMLNRVFGQPTIFKHCDKCQAIITRREMENKKFYAEMGWESLANEEQGDQQLVEPEVDYDSDAESGPFWYTCYCNQTHGRLDQAISTEEVASDEEQVQSLSIARDENLGRRSVSDEGVIDKTLDAGRWTFMKLCDKCEEIKRLELAADYNNPRLWELRAEVLGEKLWEWDKTGYVQFGGWDNSGCERFGEWKKFVKGCVASYATKNTSAEMTTSKGLSTVVEEDEN